MRVAIYDMVSSCRGDEGVSLSYPSIAWYRESYLYQSVDVFSADWFFLRLELDRNLIGRWQELDRKMVGRRFILCNLKSQVENWKIWVSGLGTELVRTWYGGDAEHVCKYLSSSPFFWHIWRVIFFFVRHDYNLTIFYKFADGWQLKNNEY